MLSLRILANLISHSAVQSSVILGHDRVYIYILTVLPDPDRESR